MNFQKSSKLEEMLKELANIIYTKLKLEPFEDIDNSLKIVSSKNYNHYFTIRRKIENLTMLLFQSGVLHDCNENDIKKMSKILDDINSLLSEA